MLYNSAISICQEDSMLLHKTVVITRWNIWDEQSLWENTAYVQGDSASTTSSTNSEGITVPRAAQVIFIFEYI